MNTSAVGFLHLDQRPHADDELDGGAVEHEAELCKAQRLEHDDGCNV
jgi:hypothetical protein